MKEVTERMRNLDIERVERQDKRSMATLIRCGGFATAIDSTRLAATSRRPSLSVGYGDSRRWRPAKIASRHQRDQYFPLQGGFGPS